LFAEDWFATDLCGEYLPFIAKQLACILIQTVRSEKIKEETKKSQYHECMYWQICGE
jgi:hypothetical protein